MKRLALILILLVLLVCSCTKQEKIPQNSLKNQSESVLESSTAESTKTEKPDKTVEFHLENGLTDIGEFSGKQIKEYFNDMVTNEFVPSDDYGTLVPFVGAKKGFYPDFDVEYEDYYRLFGLCTQDGSIVMDINPEYERFEYRQTNDGFGYYVIYRGLPEDIASYHSSASCIIPADGSWCITLENANSSVQAENGVIAVRYGFSPDTIVYFYDYEGNLINKIEDYAVYINYSDGLALVGDSDNEYERNYFFINKEGERIIGPFKKSYPFNGHGVTYLTDLNDETYLVDVTGKRLTEKSYRSIDVSFSNDGKRCAFVALRDDAPNKAGIFSETGEHISTVESNEDVLYGVELFFPSDGDLIYTLGNNWQKNWKRLSDGSDFCSKEFGVMPNHIYYDMFKSDDFYFYHNDITNFGVVFDKDGETVVSHEQMYSVESINPDLNIIIYTTGIWDYSNGIDTTVAHIYDYKNKKDIYTAKNSDTQIYFADENKEYAVIYEEKTHLLDLTTGAFVFESVDGVSVENIDGNTYFNVENNNVFTLYDRDKNVLVRNIYE